MAHWAKLSDKIGRDATMAELAEQHPHAALMFTWSLAAANIYGILPANPREYKALVWPASQLTLEQIETAIKQQAAAGLILPYSGSGPGPVRELLYICNYHKYQDVKWHRVGRPEYSLPAEWHVPDELGAYLDKDGCERSPEYYGLPGPVRDQSGTSPGPVPTRSREEKEKEKEEEDVHTSSARASEPTAEHGTPAIPPGQRNHGTESNVQASGLVTRIQTAVPSWRDGQYWRAEKFANELAVLREDELYPELTWEYIFDALETDKPSNTQRADAWLRHLKHVIRESREKRDTEPTVSPEEQERHLGEWIADMQRRAQRFSTMHGGDESAVRQSLIDLEPACAEHIDEILEAVNEHVTTAPHSG